MDTGTLDELNGTRALAILNDWERHGEVERLAEAAVCPDVRFGSRFFAVRHLGHFSDELSVSTLIRALSDEDEGVRAQAARSLRAIGEPARDAVPALTEALFDGDGPVRVSAARALGAIGDPAAIPALLKVVETNSWQTLHSWATGALVQLGAPEAEPHLVRHLGDEKAWQRRWAARTLGDVGGAASVEAVRQARKRDLLHRRVYTRAIGAMERRSRQSTAAAT